MSGTPHGYTRKLAEMHQERVNNHGRFIERREFLERVNSEIFSMVSRDQTIPFHLAPPSNPPPHGANGIDLNPPSAFLLKSNSLGGGATVNDDKSNRKMS
eukprot:GHVH01006239.1.p1 GENE.GHVH01006239.1~~GHVH01006239.1.p1  ORF type:complete len:100 (+),score=8.64 GHVH01006239.1:314-613(+)